MVGCPPCTMFSVSQSANQNKDSPEFKRQHYEALGFLGSARKYGMQAYAGRFYIHEHPVSASSWKIDSMKTLAAEYGTYLVKRDQCMFGLATIFLTNSLAVARRPNWKCDNNHRCQALTVGRAAVVPEYLDGLCDALGRRRARAKQGGIRFHSLFSDPRAGTHVSALVSSTRDWRPATHITSPQRW